MTSGSDLPAVGSPTHLHRILSVVALLSIVQNIYRPWVGLVNDQPLPALLVASAYPVVFALAAAVFVVRRTRQLVVVDVAALVVAAAIQLVSLRDTLTSRFVYRIDEGALTHQAAVTLAAGHNPYLPDFREIAARSGSTLLFNGRIAEGYEYPPLPAVLGAAVRHLLPFASETVLLCLLGIFATAVAGFCLLPTALRPLVVPAVFTFGVLPYFVSAVYPLVIAMPLLVIALHRWSSIGSGGRLGRRGIIQALALGVAAADHQLVWFVIPFVLVVLWRVRCGELGTRPGGLVVVRFAAIAGGAFLAIMVPFLVASPTVFLHRVTTPFRQHAFFNGPGLANISRRLTDGSGAVGMYSTASAALLLTLLIAVALFPSRLGPVAVVLPFVAFWFSIRSGQLYYESFVTLAILIIATTPAASFAAASPLFRPKLLRLALPAAGAAVVVVACLIAVLTPPLLELRAVTARRGHQITLTVHNRAANPIRPTFATERYGGRYSHAWRVLQGPAELPAGATASYRLGSPTDQSSTPTSPGTELYVINEDPQAIAVARFGR